VIDVAILYLHIKKKNRSRHKGSDFQPFAFSDCCRPALTDCCRLACTRWPLGNLLCLLSFRAHFFVFASCCLSPGTCVLKIGGSSSRRVVKFRNREIVQPFNAHRNGEIAERWYVTNRPTVNDGRQTNGKLLTATVGPGCW